MRIGAAFIEFAPDSLAEPIRAASAEALTACMLSAVDPKRQRDPRRTTIHDAANGRPMRLTKGADAKEGTKAAGHAGSVGRKTSRQPAVDALKRKKWVASGV